MGWCHQRNCQCGLQGTEKVGQNERKLPDFLGCTGLSHLLSPLWTCRVLQEKGGRAPKLIQRSSKLPSLPWPWGKRISILVSEGRATTNRYRVTLPPRAREEGHWAQEGYSQSFRSTGICLAGFWVRLGPITCFLLSLFCNQKVYSVSAPSLYTESTELVCFHRFTTGENLPLRMDCTLSLIHPDSDHRWCSFSH